MNLHIINWREGETELLNLTGQPIAVYDPHAPDTLNDPEQHFIGTLPIHGPPVAIETTDMGISHGVAVTGTGSTAREIPVDIIGFRDVTDLPSRREERRIIVPMVIALLAPPRPDLLVPHRPVHNSAGIVVGYRHLARTYRTD